jgi:hypothetical protein
VRKTYQIIMASRRHPEVRSFVQDVTKSGAQGRNRTLAYPIEISSLFEWQPSSVPASGPGTLFAASGYDPVPPYPSRVGVTRYTKDIISAVCCAQMQIGTRP